MATAFRFDDSAPRCMRGEREQLAAFLAAAAAELDSTGPDDLAAIEPVPLHLELVTVGAR